MASNFKAGESVKYFICPCSSSPEFHFHTIAGRYIILSFFGSSKLKENIKRHEFISTKLKKHLDDKKISYFGVSIDQDDFTNPALKTEQGVRFFWDHSAKVSVGYGALKPAFIDAGNPEKLTAYEGFTLLIDPNLRVIEAFEYTDKDHDKNLKAMVDKLPDIDQYAGNVELNAPVMIVPRVFEPELCKELIDYFKKSGGAESGFMQDIAGKTTGIIDYTFKRRKDCMIEDTHLKTEVRDRIVTRIVPQIKKAYHYDATRMERYIISCYDGKTNDFFRPHRDDTGKGTAHRRFAITLNLNEEDYEGGDLVFPEYGTKKYRAPTGGAVVFSCKLLHEATPVTKGKRYAFLPFLYDDEAAKIRESNYEALAGLTIDRNLEKKVVGSPNGAIPKAGSDQAIVEEKPKVRKAKVKKGAKKAKAKSK